MFVTSYTTYVQTNTQNKAPQSKEYDSKNSSEFTTKFSQKTAETVVQKPAVPLDYISKNNTFYTKLALEQNLDEQSKQTKELSNKFTQQSVLIDTKNAYTQTPKATYFFKEAYNSFTKTQPIDAKTLDQTQELQKKQMRKLMINTYTANENYYYRGRIA
ncbi:MAG TPA: hypothetical protein CFH84_10615 [Sulfurimonas sp. UBA12504]|nr:MAG: hypothetical protein A2019_01430 [Sulfurimonas sp. GWF2_37_8]DAB29240.1 MAG TPA: hypothetical protein CFH84_10615 [Sulfurimonas sp. UBA12504]